MKISPEISLEISDEIFQEGFNKKWYWWIKKGSHCDFCGEASEFLTTPLHGSIKFDENMGEFLENDKNLEWKFYRSFLGKWDENFRKILKEIWKKNWQKLEKNLRNYVEIREKFKWRVTKTLINFTLNWREIWKIFEKKC